MSEKFDKLLYEEGIASKLKCNWRTIANGVSSRSNQTLMEIVRSMMS